MLVAEALTVTVGVTIGFTVTTMEFDNTVALVTQGNEDVNSQVTISLLLNEDVTNVLELPPVIVPFTLQRYKGAEPALVAVAVKVTAVPAQMLVLLDVMAIVGVTAVLTFIVKLFEVAVVGVAQAEEEVSTQFTTAPLVNEEEVNVALFVPLFTVFTFHWYTGVVPPLVIEAVKTTLDPEHTDVVGVEMAIVGAEAVFTVMVIGVEITVGVEIHAAFDVISQVTTSPLFHVDDE